MNPAPQSPTVVENDSESSWEVLILTPLSDVIRRPDVARQLAKLLNTKAVYQKTPTLAFNIGDKAVLRKDWTLSVAPTWINEVRKAVDELVGTVLERVEQPNLPATESFHVAFQVPLLTDAAATRLSNIVASKNALIRRATGVALTVEYADGEAVFKGTGDVLSPETANALKVLTLAMLNSALASKRVSAKPPAPGNDKYTMRCFLLRLGLIGDDTKLARKILTRNLAGSSAWRIPPTTNIQPEPTAHVGSRVQLIQMQDPYTNLKAGEQGKIIHIDDAGTLHVEWDSGAVLGLIPGVDEYAVLNQPPINLESANA